MPQALDTGELFWQNLIDAGCSLEMIGRCMVLAQEKETAALLHLLSRHRQTLLDAVHQNEKRIDCLDYLVYKLKKKQSYKSFY